MDNNKQLRKDLLIWIDLETTGLDSADKMQGVRDHKILEIGMHITDSNYNIIDKGFEMVIHYPKEDLEKLMNPFVKDMHTKSGLLEKVQNSPYSLKDVEQKMIDYVKSYNIEPKSSPICGNNVGFDKNFIDSQMPEFSQILHYRKIDVSSIKEIVKRSFPDIAEEIDKPYKHRGLDDIQESIKELKFYMNRVFIQPEVSKKEIDNKNDVYPTPANVKKRKLSPN